MGYRELPKLNLACCGLAVTGKEADWLALAGQDEHLQRGMKALYDAFQDAPLLGSLIDPQRAAGGDLITADFSELAPLLAEALAKETPQAETEEGEELSETVIAAQGLAVAARLLAKKYHLVVTNVPYLARGKQSKTLKKFCETHYNNAKNDLANVFLDRCLQLSKKQGVVQIVMPQNWLFLKSYERQRESLLKHTQWSLLARLGEGGFDSAQAAGAFIILLTQIRSPLTESFQLRGVDASTPKTAQQKATMLYSGNLVGVSQRKQLANPACVISLEELQSTDLLSSLARAWQGLVTADDNRFVVDMWELPSIDGIWKVYLQPPQFTIHWTGRSRLIRWDGGSGDLHLRSRAHNFPPTRVLGRKGIAVQRMRELCVTLFEGEIFGDTVAPLIFEQIEDDKLLPALWCYCESGEFRAEVRKLTQKVNTTPGTLAQIHFDRERWLAVANNRYPNGLPKPYSDDPTQWIFHGHPKPATDPLQVAIARLLGYIWPAETPSPPAPNTVELSRHSGMDRRNPGCMDASSLRHPWNLDSGIPCRNDEQPLNLTAVEGEGSQEMELSDEAHAWIAQSAKLAHHADDDGIVCLPPLRGEKSAAERVLNLLIDAWETVEPGSWKASILDKLLAEADCAGKSLGFWLREKFFEQHCKRFHHRPFIWHIWDGQKDGFAALVNYHKLDAKNLERLIHTYLGDWIRSQEQGVKDNIDGAVTRLAAARNLQQRLELIFEGEAPYDIFVRWKPLAEQPIGWNPDLNDGVRLNIRPFMTAEVLRHNKLPKLNIKWDKDRGKDVPSAPWFPVFNGDRINDHHLRLAEKRHAKATTG